MISSFILFLDPFSEISADRRNKRKRFLFNLLRELSCRLEGLKREVATVINIAKSGDKALPVGSKIVAPEVGGLCIGHQMLIAPAVIIVYM